MSIYRVSSSYTVPKEILSYLLSPTVMGSVTFVTYTSRNLLKEDKVPDYSTL